MTARARDVGTPLPELRIEATPTFVVATALATRDFQDVHHDRDCAQRPRHRKDIFLNILTDTGLVQRYVTDWAGPQARVHEHRDPARRAGYAYDTLVFSGEVTAVDGDDVTVAVVGRGQLGDHVDRHRHGRRGDAAREPGAERARRRSPASARPSSRRTPAAAELRLAAEARPGGPRRRRPAPADVDGLVTFTMDTNTEAAVAREVGIP